MNDWFRSWHGAPTDPKWLSIAKKAHVATGIAVAVAWALLDRASQADDRGSITGYDAEGLACFFGCEETEVESVITAMHDKGVLINGAFAKWQERQPKSEEAIARKRQWRAEKAALCHDLPPNATTCHALPQVATECHAPPPIATQIREEKRREEKRR